MNKNDNELREMIFEDAYAYNELEAYTAQFTEDNPSAKELRRAVKWYYDILTEKPTEMSINFLRRLLERRTFTPIENKEEQWIQSTYDPDIWEHKRRKSLLRKSMGNDKNGNKKWFYIDVDAYDVLDQNMKHLDPATAAKIIMLFNDIQFPYMYNGKSIIFAAVFSNVVKIVSFRTPEGTTVRVNKCFKLDGMTEITEEEWERTMIIESGKETLDKLESPQDRKNS